jgi:MoaA/NifB/PqqE/SkfB family radical SAM enzyme
VSFLTYSKPYVDDPQQFYQSIKDRTVVPHQIEFQPGSLSSKICWMECPHCYGINTEHSPERLTLERYHELLDECASIPKVIFSGYATDPLFYKHTPELIAHAVRQAQIVGIHSKCLKINSQFIESVQHCQHGSYISISLDAYDDKTYSEAHGYPHAVYDKIVTNIDRIARETLLQININYLVNDWNNDAEGFLKMYQDVMRVGADVVRFSIAQQPHFGESAVVPNRVDWSLVEGEAGVEIYDVSGDEAQVVPCWARWLFPAISYDGHLARCSETSSPTWSDIRLGSLHTHSFWDLYYDYCMFETKALQAAQCMCDRKQMWANRQLNSTIGVVNEMV